VPDFDLTGIFNRLADFDYDKAVELAWLKQRSYALGCDHRHRASCSGTKEEVVVKMV
jgi:hypothetical protein